MLAGQSVRVPCLQSGCGCKAFAFVPSRPEDVGEYWLPKRRNFDPAAWRLNCRCKHNHEEHDVGGQHRCLSVSFWCWVNECNVHVLQLILLLIIILLLCFNDPLIRQCSIKVNFLELLLLRFASLLYSTYIQLFKWGLVWELGLLHITGVMKQICLSWLSPF